MHDEAPRDDRTGNTRLAYGPDHCKRSIEPRTLTLERRKVVAKRHAASKLPGSKADRRHRQRIQDPTNYIGGS